MTPRWVTAVHYDLKVGTYILVREPKLKNFVYKHGKVIQIFKSEDGLIRKVGIQTIENKKPIIRDIRSCALLESTYWEVVKKNDECSKSQMCIIPGTSVPNYGYLDYILQE